MKESSVGRQLPNKMEFEKLVRNVAQHLKPLYMCVLILTINLSIVYF